MSEKIARLNDVHRPGEEVLVLRHHKLKKGSHPAFKQASERGVWLVYEKIGTRVVGDFKVVHPQGGGSDDYDESYRLARYASLQHWRETRKPVDMMGDGPLLELSRSGGATRRTFLLGSDGAYFMTGRMVEDAPYHLTGLEAGPGAVRYDKPLPGDEIAELECWKIRKGNFDVFDDLTRTRMMPVISKMGARPLGIWRLIHPEPAIGTESDDYDQVMMITRYASYQHWQAAREPARLIGDGPDYQEFANAAAERENLVLDKWQRFLEGELYRSPPTFTPPTRENEDG